MVRATWTGAVAGAPARGSGDRVAPETFVRDYAATWKNLDRDSFALQVAGFYNTEGAILNPGMDKPIGKPQIPGYYQMVRSAAPDLTMQAARLGRRCGATVHRVGVFHGRMGRHRPPADVPRRPRRRLRGTRDQAGCAYLDTLTMVCLTHPWVGKAPREFLGDRGDASRSAAVMRH